MLQHTSPEVINRNAPYKHLGSLVHLAHQLNRRVSLVTMIQRLRMPGVALGTTTQKKFAFFADFFANHVIYSD